MPAFSVSVLIPTFNRAQYLKRAIDSVITQSYAHWELLIIDDGSTDDTPEVVKSYIDNRIMYIPCRENKGVSHARNLGIRAAHKPWIALLDSDDEWLPKKLEKQIQFLKNHPEFKFVHCDEMWFRQGVRVNPHNKHKKMGGRIYKACLPLCCVSPSASLVHHSLFEDEGLFDENFPVCEDYELWLRLFSKHEVGFISEPLLKKYGGHEDQLSKKYFAMDYWRVKALANNLSKYQSYLTSEEQHETIQQILTKCQILINGYNKHKNWINFDEIQSLFTNYQSLKEFLV